MNVEIRLVSYRMLFDYEIENNCIFEVDCPLQKMVADICTHTEVYNNGVKISSEKWEIEGGMSETVLLSN